MAVGHRPEFDDGVRNMQMGRQAGDLGQHSSYEKATQTNQGEIDIAGTGKASNLSVLVQVRGIDGVPSREGNVPSRVQFF